MNETLAVLGAGTMGAGIAHVAALAGFEVKLFDVSEAARAAGVARIAAGLDGGVARKKLTAEVAAAALARVAPADDLAGAVAGAAAVIEAVFEDLALKQKLFAAIEEAAPADALLATNTSSLSVGAIAGAARRPERVVGMHFFNPVHLMKLVEIVRHPTTDEAVVARARALAERLGKEPIVVRDAPGFASSRLGVLVGLEAIRMVEQGVASAEDIDKAMKLGYGHPMGPLELGDLVGLDVRLAIAEYLERELGPAFRPPELLRRKVAEGKLGKKTGEGFYVWK
ncbi:MAG TPA: 3-hydroxyacyl-CoA dehydrogenase family protein [Haliangiales bacterium]|nr:3-hydroxyacyl-CoA dehydrogenase family protein [Haliangiales bacterium]